MKIRPQKNKIYINNKPIEETDITKLIALIFVFVGVFGFAFKLVFL